MWGGNGAIAHKKWGSPVWATPWVRVDLLVEAAAESVLHAAGE
jgi:hypothetical protein